MNENQFSLLFDKLPVGIYWTNLQGEILEGNQALVDLLGFPDKQALFAYSAVDLYVDIEDRRKWQALLQQHDEVNGFEIQVRRADNSVIWISQSVTGIKNDHGEIIYYLGIVEDITQRKAAVEALQREQNFTNRIVSTIQLIVMILDKTGHIVSVNPYFEELTGYQEKEIKGKEWFDTFLLEHERDFIRDLFLGAVDDTQTHGNVNTILHKNGHEILVEWYDKTVKDDEGKVIGLISIGQDVTERIRIQEALKKSQEELEERVKERTAELVQTNQQLQEEINERNRIEKQLHSELAINTALAKLANDLINPSKSIEDIAHLVLASAKKLTNSEHGFVSAIDLVSGNNIGYTLTEMMGSQCQMSEDQQYLAFPIGPDGKYGKLWGHALNTREGFYTNTPQDHPATGGIPEGHIPLRNFLSVPAVIGDQLLGQVALSNAAQNYTDEHLAIIKRLTDLYALAVQRRRNDDILYETHRELEHRNILLNCLTNISEAAETAVADPDLFYKSCAHLVNMSCYFPPKTCTRLTVEQRAYTTDNFQETRWKQSHDINISGEKIGTLEIFYLDDRMTKVDAIILQQDLDLLHAAAGRIESAVEKIRAERELEKYRQHLEVMVDQRTAELVQANQQLQEEVAERSRVEDALRQNEVRYRTVADFTYNWEYWIDSEGKYIYISPSCERVTGYAADEIIQDPKLLDKIIHPDDLEMVKNHLEQQLKEYIDVVPLEFRIVTRDGRIRWIEHICQPVYCGDGEWCGRRGSNVDITERKLAEEALKGSEQFNRQILTNVRSGVVVYDREFKVKLWNRYLEELIDLKAEEAIGKPVFDILPYLKGTNANTEQLLQEALNGNTVTSPDTHFEVPESGKQGWVSRSYSPYYASDGETIAGVIGVVLDITDRKKGQRIQEALVSIANALRAAHNQKDMLPIILDWVTDFFKAEGVTIALLEPESGDIVFEAKEDLGLWVPDRRLKSDQGLTADILKTGQIYNTKDIATEEKPTSHVNKKLSRSFVGVPMVANDRNIGVLWIGRKHVFSDDDERVLIAVCELIAGAIQRAALHEDVRRQLRRLQALHTVDQAITSDMNLHATLDVFIDQVMQELEVDAADILLLDPYSQMLEHETSKGFLGDTIRHFSIRVGEDYAGTCALEQRTIHVTDFNTRTTSFTPSSFAAYKFSHYYCTPLVSKGAVKGVLEVYLKNDRKQSSEWLSFFETLATQGAIAIDDSQNTAALRRTNFELETAYNTTLEGWAKALELRDNETEGHSRRVTEMTIQLARAMGMTDKELLHVRRGALLHDIGKMGVPDSILHKPGPLNDEEWVIMRKHPDYAYQLISPISYLRPALDIPYCHHEKWDGSGYPRGLVGDQIPLAARVFAIIDVWDALLSDRPYRKALPEEEVLAYLKSNAGTHFDPQVVDTFLAILAA